MHKQYVYFSSIPIWFCEFVFLLRWSNLFSSTNSPLFICILLSVLFGLLNIFYVILWSDIHAFNDECKRWHTRGFRLRFAFRGCQFISRNIWLAYFWIFIGSGPFMILLLILIINHIYLFCRGYLRSDIYHIITKLFIIPDMSVGAGYRNNINHKKVDWPTKILYIITHCAGCLVGFWTIVGEDLLYIDMLFWLHWFEDLLFWAIITGIADQEPIVNNSIMVPTNIWSKMLQPNSLYVGFYSVGIITWFFQAAYFMIIRVEEFIFPKCKSLLTWLLTVERKIPVEFLFPEIFLMD